MDPDFMKGSQREQPFTPAPDRSLTPWFAALFLFACIAGLGYNLIDWRGQTPGASNKPVAAKPDPTPPVQQSQPQQAPPTAPDPGTRIVTKCVTNGKTTYGDGGCAQGATATPLTTKADYNLVAGMTPAQMNAANRIKPESASLSVFSQNGNSPPTSAGDCKGLDEYIKYLDAMARQPQSASVQDWIRDERKKARDRQFAIHC